MLLQVLLYGAEAMMYDTRILSVDVLVSYHGIRYGITHQLSTLIKVQKLNVIL